MADALTYEEREEMMAILVSDPAIDPARAHWWAILALTYGRRGALAEARRLLAAERPPTTEGA